MKAKKFIIPTVVLFSYAIALAGSSYRQATVTSEEAGDSAALNESAEPKTYEYNENWLDSVPYLMEHARNGEKWAYENLAECFRYGKGGLEKSMANALSFYEKSGNVLEDIAKEVYQSDPNDELGLFTNLIERLDRRTSTKEEILKELAAQHAPLPKSMALLETLLKREDEFTQKPETVKTLLDPRAGADEYLVALWFVTHVESNESFTSIVESKRYNDLILALADKAPEMSDVIGEKLFQYYSQDPVDHRDYLDKSLDLFYKADRFGMLGLINARHLLNYCAENNLDEIAPFSKDDISRLYERYKDSLLDTEAAVEEEVIVIEEPESPSANQ